MADLSLETQGFFPGRGRGWRAWEDEFLKTFSAELGLRVSAEQLRRPPADVALRISWLGIQMPADKVNLAPHGKATAPKLEKKPSAMSGAKAEPPEGWMTCAEVAKLAGCTVGVVYSSIWKKRLDALQGDRGVWLVPEDAGREFAEQRKAKTPENAPQSPVEAKEGGEADNLPSETENAVEPPSEAQKGHEPEKPAEEISPELPFTAAQPVEARCHADHEATPVKGPSPQAMDLGSMSRLDILRAIASGKLEACNVQ